VLKIDTDLQGNLTNCNSVNGDDYPVLIDIIEENAIIEGYIEGMGLIPRRIEHNELVDKRLPLDKPYAKSVRTY
jgi:cellulose biosynthesis protein BcsQ